MDLKGKKIILGSNSPRRRELLGGLDVPFTVDTGNTFVENFPEGTLPHDVPSVLSRGKSHGFHRPLEADEILVTADTVVILGASVLGKPHSREEAVRMLSELSGKTHEVVTSVTLRSLSAEHTLTDVTSVTFKDLTEAEISYYVDVCKPFDKAGAYGIQEWIGYIGIASITGSYFNVMGFPVHRVYEALQKMLSIE